jgi:hypothetical protein
MSTFRKAKVVALAGIAIVLVLTFAGLPLIGHAYRKHHPPVYPSVVPVKDWKRFSSEQGKFSVLFPGSPEVTNAPVTTPVGSINMQTFFAWADVQPEYAVIYCDEPKETSRLYPQQQFDASQKSVAVGDSSKLEKMLDQKWKPELDWD